MNFRHARWMVPLGSSVQVSCDGPTIQRAYEGGEVRSEDFREASSSRPTSGVLTGAIAALLSSATGFLLTFMVNDITGKSHQWLFWPVAGLYFAIWIAEQQTFRK